MIGLVQEEREEREGGRNGKEPVNARVDMASSSRYGSGEQNSAWINSGACGARALLDMQRKNDKGMDRHPDRVPSVRSTFIRSEIVTLY